MIQFVLRVAFFLFLVIGDHRLFGIVQDSDVFLGEVAIGYSEIFACASLFAHSGNNHQFGMEAQELFRPYLLGRVACAGCIRRNGDKRRRESSE